MLIIIIDLVHSFPIFLHDIYMLHMNIVFLHSLHLHIYHMGLGSVMDVSLTSKAEGRELDSWLDARFLPQHVDPQLIGLWSIVKRLMRS